MIRTIKELNAALHLQEVIKTREKAITLYAPAGSCEVLNPLLASDKFIPKLSELSGISVQDLRHLTPEIIYTKKENDNTTNALTSAIIRYGDYLGGVTERISSQGRYIQGEKYVDAVGIAREFRGKYIPSNGVVGTADISLTYKGKSIKIEVKFGNDRQSEAQRRYQKRIEAAGGIYMIVRTFNDFASQMEKIINN